MSSEMPGTICLSPEMAQVVRDSLAEFVARRGCPGFVVLDVGIRTYVELRYGRMPLGFQIAKCATTAQRVVVAELVHTQISKLSFSGPAKTVAQAIDEACGAIEVSAIAESTSCAIEVSAIAESKTPDRPLTKLQRRALAAFASLGEFNAGEAAVALYGKKAVERNDRQRVRAVLYALERVGLVERPSPGVFCLLTQVLGTLPP